VKPGVVIDSARDADRDAIVRLLAAQVTEHRIQPNPEALERLVTQVLEEEQQGFLTVARAGNELVGVAYVAIILSMEHGGRAGWLEELYVMPEYREQGIGTRLLSAVLSRGRELDLVALELEVDIEHQRAEALYARQGFRRLPRSRWVNEIRSGAGPAPN
jgi:ribosomal protein S18 acetylase RimI-like enzyme